MHRPTPPASSRIRKFLAPPGIGRAAWAALPLILLAGSAAPPPPGSRASIEEHGDAPVRASAGHVILISVDGLRPDAITRRTAEELPNFYRLRDESAFTDNARTDYHYSVTLPNHVTQLTGRGVEGAHGHNWTANRTPDGTIHSNKDAYVTSAFDVAHDSGLRTAAYVSKDKLALLFDRSYDEANGAVDRTGENDGRDKIDTFVYEDETAKLVDRLIRDLREAPAAFTFVHLKDADAAGHSRRWNLKAGSSYTRAVAHVDRLIGEVLRTVENDPRLSGTTTVIVTTDHGGSLWSHGNEKHAGHYTIPFYVWGAGVQPGDLYDLNAGARLDPGEGRPGYDQAAQPIRNGDAANLALRLLGLGTVPGSTIGAAQPLVVSNALADRR